MATKMPGINPQALIKSMREQYNYLIATGVSEPLVYQQMAAAAAGYANLMAEQAKGDPNSAFTWDQWNSDFTRLYHDLDGAAKNAGVVQYARARDNFLNPAGATDDQLINDVQGKLDRGEIGLEDAVKILMGSGRFDVTEMQKLASKVGIPGVDPAADTSPTNSTDSTLLDYLKGLGNGGSSYKPFEQVPYDVTDPQTEFQKGFSEFSRGLATNHKGEAPNIGVLAQRYQDLFTQWEGDLQKGIKEGTQPENLWKETYVNIGKSTDPQFDQTTDRFQRSTVRPKESVADWLAKNVDPEDLYMSTTPDQRPGRATGGFRGYVRRSNV